MVFYLIHKCDCVNEVLSCELLLCQVLHVYFWWSEKVPLYFWPIKSFRPFQLFHFDSFRPFRPKKFKKLFISNLALYIVIDKDDKSLFFSLTLSTLLPDHKTINIKGKILSSSVVMIFLRVIVLSFYCITFMWLFSMISKTPYFLTNKIISTISTFRPFRLSKIISTFNFDHGPKVEIFRLSDFNFDFKYRSYTVAVTFFNL